MPHWKRPYCTTPCSFICHITRYHIITYHANICNLLRPLITILFLLVPCGSIIIKIKRIPTQLVDSSFLRAALLILASFWSSNFLGLRKSQTYPVFEGPRQPASRPAASWQPPARLGASRSPSEAGVSKRSQGPETADGRSPA